MSSTELITFVLAEGETDCMRQVPPSGVVSAEVVEVAVGYRLIAKLHDVPGTWCMSSPGGLADTLISPQLFETFIDVVLKLPRADRRLAA